MVSIQYRVRPDVSNAALNALFAAAWPEHRETDFAPIHQRSLLYVCAYADDSLIGYVNLAWDGGIHAFLLDTTVHPDYRRQGIGVTLVRQAVTAAHGRGVEWLHVDYEPHLTEFYRRCGFQPTEAGLLRLDPDG